MGSKAFLRELFVFFCISFFCGTRRVEGSNWAFLEEPVYTSAWGETVTF